MACLTGTSMLTGRSTSARVNRVSGAYLSDKRGLVGVWLLSGLRPYEKEVMRTEVVAMRSYDRRSDVEYDIKYLAKWPETRTAEWAESTRNGSPPILVFAHSNTEVVGAASDGVDILADPFSPFTRRVNSYWSPEMLADFVAQYRATRTAIHADPRRPLVMVSCDLDSEPGHGQPTLAARFNASMRQHGFTAPIYAANAAVVPDLNPQTKQFRIYLEEEPGRTEPIRFRAYTG